MCLIVGALSRIGVFVANVSRQSAKMLEVKRPTRFFARRFQRRSATMCVTKLAWRGRDVVATIFGVKKNILISSPAVFDWDVCVRYGDYVHRFVSLLNWGPHTA